MPDAGGSAAPLLGLPFAEINAAITRDAGLSPAEIFALYGDAGYRRIEEAALRQRIDTTATMVPATVGGSVKHLTTCGLLLAHFHTIWLTAPLEAQMARVRAQGDERPMTGDPHAMAMRERLVEINRRHATRFHDDRLPRAAVSSGLPRRTALGTFAQTPSPGSTHGYSHHQALARRNARPRHRDDPARSRTRGRGRGSAPRP